MHEQGDRFVLTDEDCIRLTEAANILWDDRFGRGDMTGCSIASNILDAIGRRKSISGRQWLWLKEAAEWMR